MKCLKCEVFVV